MSLWPLVLSEAGTSPHQALIHGPSTGQGACELTPRIPASRLSPFAAREILPALELPRLMDQGWSLPRGLLWVEQCSGKTRVIRFFPKCQRVSQRHRRPCTTGLVGAHCGVTLGLGRSRGPACRSSEARGLATGVGGEERVVRGRALSPPSLTGGLDSHGKMGPRREVLPRAVGVGNITQHPTRCQLQ